jgi:hypothetical protein
MPKRVSSDEEDYEDSKGKRKKIKPAPKAKPSASKTRATGSRNAKRTAPEAQSIISAWAKRQAVETLDGIEDIEAEVSPKRATTKPVFQVEEGGMIVCLC